MLRFAEEIVLPILDDGGEIARVPRWPLRCPPAGGRAGPDAARGLPAGRGRR